MTFHYLFSYRKNFKTRKNNGFLPYKLHISIAYFAIAKTHWKTFYFRFSYSIKFISILINLYISWTWSVSGIVATFNVPKTSQVDWWWKFGAEKKKSGFLSGPNPEKFLQIFRMKSLSFSVYLIPENRGATELKADKQHHTLYTCIWFSWNYSLFLIRI